MYKMILYDTILKFTLVSRVTLTVTLTIILGLTLTPITLQPLNLTLTLTLTSSLSQNLISERRREGWGAAAPKMFGGRQPPNPVRCGERESPQDKKRFLIGGASKSAFGRPDVRF